MNKRTVALSREDYKKIIEHIQTGFQYEDETGKHKFRPNTQLAVILQLEATTGLRISDILKLRIKNMPKDGNRHRLDVIEQKTKKPRTFTVPENVYQFICIYAMEHGKGKDDFLFTVKERAVQKQLAIVCDYLGLERVSTHSFRKSFATTAYENSGYNIELVRQLLQHSNTTTTQRYIGVAQREIENALTSVTSEYLVG